MEYGIRRDLCAAALFGVPAVEAVLALGCAGQRGQLLIGGGHVADRGRTAVSVKGDDELGSGVLLRNQRKPRCGFVPCAVLCAEGENTAVFIQRTGNGKGSVAACIDRCTIISINDFASRIRCAGDLIRTRGHIGIEYRIGERQHGCCFVHAHQQEYAGHILCGAVLNLGNAVDFEHQTALKVGNRISTVRIRRNLVVASLVHSCDFVGDVLGRAAYRQHIVLAVHIGAIYAMFIGCAGRSIHGEHHIQRRIFRQIHTILRRLGFRAVILAALDGFIGTNAHLVSLVFRQVFRLCCFFSTHSQRHIDGGRFFIEVVTKAGVDPVVAVFLINRHGVAVGISHGTPCRRHDLISGQLQRNSLGCGRLVLVLIAYLSIKLLMVDGDKAGQGFLFAVLVDAFHALFRHQERGHIVFARRGQRTHGGNIDRDAGAVRYLLLVDQIIRAALFFGKIGAKHILCVFLGVFDLTGHLLIVQSQLQFFKRSNGNALGFLRVKRK